MLLLLLMIYNEGTKGQMSPLKDCIIIACIFWVCVMKAALPLLGCAVLDGK